MSDGARDRRAVGERYVALSEADLPAAEASAPARALQAYRQVALVLGVVDAACIMSALVATYAIIGTGRRGAEFMLVLAAASVLWIGLFHAFGLYSVARLSASEEFRGIIGASASGVVAVFIAAFWWSEPLTRAWFGWTLLFALGFELIARRAFRWYVGKLRASGHLTLRTLVIGTDEEAGRVARALRATPGFNPLGYVAVDSKVATNGLPILGDLNALEGLLRQHDVECVVLSATALDPDEIMRVSRICRQGNTEIRISANLPLILTSRMSIQPIDDLLTLSMRPVRLTGTQAALKRAVDVGVASVTLLLLSPLLAVIALAIRVTSPGPIIFRQARVTQHGRVFTVYKFRTMASDPAVALEGAVIDLTKPFFKLQDDPRLTRVGRLLRPLSLDELPQLWNVVRGDMSIVGPRPLPLEQVEANLQLLAPRHEVRAGLTGWWQINGRSDVDSERALRMDLFYIENWSTTLDLYIVLKSIGVIIMRRGAR